MRDTEALDRVIADLVRAHVPLKVGIETIKARYINAAIRRYRRKRAAARALGINHKVVTRYADRKRTNRELLDRVRRRILADPLILEMDDYFTECALRSGQRQHCIAMLCLLESGRAPEDVMDPHDEARKAARLTRKAADSLFLISGWPKDLRHSYVTEPITRRDYERNAELVSRRLERFGEFAHLSK